MIAPVTTGSPLRRDRSNGAVAGVCAGIARQTGLDVALIRVIFIALAFAGGVGVAIYAVLWALLPQDGQEGRAFSIPQLRGRGGIEVGLGVGLLLLSLLLTLRALGIWWSDVVTWPVVLIATGAALLWREVGARAAPATAVAEAEPEEEEPAAVASRMGLGAGLVIAAGVAFLWSTGALSAARDVLLSVVVVAVVLVVIFGPWIVRLARSLAEERAERIRSQERSEISAHLHDSVLQTLALVQQRSGDPKAVEALGAALEAAAGEVERDHGARVEVVSVGEVPLDERALALVAAAREAMVNAAKFGGDSVVDVFAEAGSERVEVFVRDRGPGFDPGSVAADRRGVRESIIGRMERHGGRAVINS